MPQLIENAGQVTTKAWSMRFMALAAASAPLLDKLPDWVPALDPIIPPEAKVYVPMILAIAGMISRVIKQRKLSPPQG